MANAVSQNGISIRLPDERWEHIIIRHEFLSDKKDLVLETIAEPDRILDGDEGALMAVKQLEPGKMLVVVYKEESPEDGFIITAFPTRGLSSLNRRRQLWLSPKKP